MSALKRQIVEVLDKFDALPLECDGFTRIASYALSDAGIEHEVMGGCVVVGDKKVDPHFWIEIAGLTVDYRLRMWLGPKMPHGVFKRPKKVEYYGDPVHLPCTKDLFEMLTDDWVKKAIIP